MELHDLGENMALPLEQYTDLSPGQIRELVSLKLCLVGLAGFEEFYPSEISGGMRKRAALARAMALDPDILFFDEPSAGLDPVSSRLLDDLILELRDSLGSTIVVVTHELASIFAIGNNSIYLDVESRTITASGDPKKLRDESKRSHGASISHQRRGRNKGGEVMSKPANKTLIGIFVLGAIALLVVAIVLLGSGKFFGKMYVAVCYFEGSVGGLNIGAPVVFRGVKVGSVKDVILRFDTENLAFQIPVYIEIDTRTAQLMGPRPSTFGKNLKLFIDRGLRAQLEMQSIVTGQMQVGLDFYPGKPAKLIGDSKYPEIPTIPTPLQELTKKVGEIPIEKILKNVQSAIEGIERTINSPEIANTLKSVSQAAGETNDLVKNINRQVTPLVSNANDTVKDLQKLVRNLDQQTSTLASSLGETTKDVRSMVQNVDSQVKTVGFRHRRNNERCSSIDPRSQPADWGTGHQYREHPWSCRCHASGGAGDSSNGGGRRRRRLSNDVSGDASAQGALCRGTFASDPGRLSRAPSRSSDTRKKMRLGGKET